MLSGHIGKVRCESGCRHKRILLIPPDYTRKHSGAGKITAILYKLLAGREVDVLPALGTHEAMTETEMLDMFEGQSPG